MFVRGDFFDFKKTLCYIPLYLTASNYKVMNKENYIPVDQANLDSNRVRVNIPFPGWVETDRIGIDLTRTHKLMDLGGIASVQLRSSEDAAANSVPMIVGMAPDGSGYAGRAGRKTYTPESSSDFDLRSQNMFYHNYDWANVDIKLNKKVIEQKINNAKGNLRKAESWAPYMDRALKKGMLESGTRHLLVNLKPSQVFWAVFVNMNPAFDAVRMMVSHFKPSTVETYVFIAAFNVVWFNLMNCTFRSGIGRNGSGYRINLIPGYEIDRAFLFQILARTAPLIAPIPETR